MLQETAWQHQGKATNRLIAVSGIDQNYLRSQEVYLVRKCAETERKSLHAG
jgi:hypothetical protein